MVNYELGKSSVCSKRANVASLFRKVHVSLSFKLTILNKMLLSYKSKQDKMLKMATASMTKSEEIPSSTSEYSAVNLSNRTTQGSIYSVTHLYL